MKKIVIILGILVILVMPTLTLPTKSVDVSSSAILIVDDEGDGDFTTIQSAVDHSSSVQPERSGINSIFLLDSERSSNHLGGPMDSPWPTFSHDNQHTSQSPYNTRNNPMEIKWKFATNLLGFESSPVIDQEGTLYIGCKDYNLYAINPDGTEKWRFNLNGWSSRSAALGNDGTIYIGSWDQKLYAINANGTLKWKFNAQGGIDGSPTIGSDGILYFGVLGPGGNGRIYALNSDGTEKWYMDTGQYVYSTPTIGYDGIVYISSNDRYLYALNPQDGSIYWKFRTGDVMGTPSVGPDGTIYGACYDDHLYAIHPNGTLSWKTKIDYGSYGTPAIGEDGTIYIGGKYFYSVHPNGTIKWTYKGWESYEYQINSIGYALSADGLIYFVATKGSGQGGDLFVLNCDDGILHNQINIAPDDDQYAQPVIGSDGTVYVGSQFTGNPHGFLYAFGTSNENHPPDKPDINGPSTGQTQEEQTYTFTINDVNNDEVFLFVDWGDETNSGWIGPYTSGEEITLVHTWNWKGTYTVKAKAMDEHEVQGEWATLEVSMPKNKNAVFDSIILRFFNEYPRLFLFIQHLL